MSTLREAAQQALETMDKATRYMSDSDYMKLNQAIDDLRAALAQEEQDTDCHAQGICQRSGYGIGAQEEQANYPEEKLQAVAEYISNQYHVWYGVAARDVEEVLRQSVSCGLVNNPPRREEGQEPVARVLQTVGQYHTGRFVAEVETVRRLRDGESLYTHPPRREWQSLTEEEINRHWHDTDWRVPLHDRIVPFTRAVEAALKERNNG